MLCDYYLVPGIEEGERKKKKKARHFFFFSLFQTLCNAQRPLEIFRNF